MPEAISYIEEHDDTYYVRGQRVRLTSLVHDWNEGASPEAIAEHFPVLTLTEVYGAIAYYLENREMLDQHFIALTQHEMELEAVVKASYSEQARALHERLLYALLPSILDKAFRGEL